MRFRFWYASLPMSAVNIRHKENRPVNYIIGFNYNRFDIPKLKTKINAWSKNRGECYTGNAFIDNLRPLGISSS